MQHEVIKPMAEYDTPERCPECKDFMWKPPYLNAPKVMNVALPDGTRRFDGVRKANDIEKQKRSAQAEQRKKLAAEAKERDS